MGRCKWCKKLATLNNLGYCNNCYDTIRTDIQDCKDLLSKLESHANISLSQNQKQAIIDKTTACCNHLQQYRDRNVPFFKSNFYLSRINIFNKMGLPVDAPPPEPVPIVKKKFQPVLIWSLAIIMFLCSAGILYFLSVETSNFELEKQQLKIQLQDANAIIQSQDATITELRTSLDNFMKKHPLKKIYRLKSGHYVSGEDFEPGIYDIEAKRGLGNVYSDNVVGGINAIMGRKSDDPLGVSEQKYSNISLPEGTILSVRDVEILITRT